MKTTGHAQSEVEAERQLLSSLIMDETCFESHNVTIDHFTDDIHRQIFDAIAGIIEAGKRPILPEVTQSLADAGTLTAVGGLTYLTQICDAAGDYRQWPQVQRILQSQHKRRELHTMLLGRLDKVFEDDTTEFVNSLIVDLSDLTTAENDDHELSTLEARLQHEALAEDRLMTIPTGLRHLDEMLTGGGISPGQSILIGGRPAEGKTVLLGQIALNIAALDVPVGLITLEMTAGEMSGRFLTRLRANEYDALPMWFVDSKFDVRAIEIAIRRLVKVRRCKVVCIDYLQLIEASKTNKNAIREQEISAISRKLKLLARSLKISVVVAAQLNRAAEGADLPSLRHLRESGSIEQDADIVLLLKAFEHVPDRTKRHVKMVIAKQRNGRVGVIEFLLHGSKFYFEEFTAASRINDMDFQT